MNAGILLYFSCCFVYLFFFFHRKQFLTVNAFFFVLCQILYSGKNTYEKNINLYSAEHALCELRVNYLMLLCKTKSSVS